MRNANYYKEEMLSVISHFYNGIKPTANKMLHTFLKH